MNKHFKDALVSLMPAWLGFLLIASCFPIIVFGLLLGEELLTISGGVVVATGFYLIADAIKERR